MQYHYNNAVLKDYKRIFNERLNSLINKSLKFNMRKKISHLILQGFDEKTEPQLQ